jgi:hypothetical protein
MAHVFSAKPLWIPLLIVPTILIAFYCMSKRYMLDAESMKRYPSIEPDMLPILSGERKPRMGYRYRTNFWNDSLLYGVWLCIMQGIACSACFYDGTAPYISPWPKVIFALSIVAYLYFVVSFAGIVRRRYWGFIGFTLFFILLDCSYAYLIEPLLLRDYIHSHAVSLSDMPLIVSLLPLVFIPLCIVAVGVIGLVVFRKQKSLPND